MPLRDWAAGRSRCTSPLTFINSSRNSIWMVITLTRGLYRCSSSSSTAAALPISVARLRVAALISSSRGGLSRLLVHSRTTLLTLVSNLGDGGPSRSCRHSLLSDGGRHARAGTYYSTALVPTPIFPFRLICWPPSIGRSTVTLDGAARLFSRRFFQRCAAGDSYLTAFEKAARAVAEHRCKRLPNCPPSAPEPPHRYLLVDPTQPGPSNAHAAEVGGTAGRKQPPYRAGVPLLICSPDESEWTVRVERPGEIALVQTKC